MPSFAFTLPFGLEFASYRAPATIAGLGRLVSLDRQFMADAGCWGRLTLCGRSFEFWGPVPS
jgi:hypothetical protein